MAATASRKSSGQILRSLPPSGRFYNSRPTPAPYSSSAFASSTSSFSSRSTTLFRHSISPSGVNVCGSSGSVVPSVRFSLDRSISPNRSISVAGTGQVVRRQSHHRQKRTCMCSPTTHPGSFRCSLHKSFHSPSAAVAPYSPDGLNARGSAMTSSLVRIGGVEGGLLKRTPAALIRPSSHQQRRRCDFRPGPSRLSIMSKVEEDS